MGESLKVKKKCEIWRYQGQKNITRKTEIKIKFYFTRKKEHSFFADTKLQFDQIKRKISGNVQKAPFYLKTNNFTSQNDYKLSS